MTTTADEVIYQGLTQNLQFDLNEGRYQIMEIADQSFTKTFLSSRNEFSFLFILTHGFIMAIETIRNNLYKIVGQEQRVRETATGGADDCDHAEDAVPEL